MRKFSLFAALLLIVSVLAGCADAGQNNDTVPSDLTYTGTFLDLVAEGERSTPPEDGELKITKVDKETGWCVVPAMSSGDAEFLYPRMDYDGERYHDAEAVSQILRIPLYAQAVLNHSKPVPYCFIPIDGFGESLDTIMDVQGSGVVLTDRNPGNGIETLSISPAQVQLSLFS